MLVSIIIVAWRIYKIKPLRKPQYFVKEAIRDFFKIIEKESEKTCP
jgi:hypothetical protein